MQRFTATLAMGLAAKRIHGALAAASVMQVSLNVGLFFEAVETLLIGGGEAPSMKTFPDHDYWRKSYRNSFGLSGLSFAYSAISP